MINRTSRRILPASIALTACLLAAGCTSTSKSTTTTAPADAAPSSASAPAAASVSITIRNFAFIESGPAAAGSMVQVTNNDGEAHTVTADTGKAFDVTVQPGRTATFSAPRKAGSYKFHCTFHSNMHGTLTVTA